MSQNPQIETEIQEVRARESDSRPQTPKLRSQADSAGVVAATDAEVERWQGIARRGEAIYEDRIRARVEERSRGKFLVLDVETGEYEIDENHLAAATRLRKRLPNAVAFGLRIGYPSAYRLGSRSVGLRG